MNNVSNIIDETAKKLADEHNLRSLQTKLYKEQLEERLHGPKRRKTKARLHSLKRKLRARCHFGSNASFENKIEETLSSENHLYFKFSSGQLVRADRSILPGRNPVVRAMAVKEIEANAART